MYIFESRIRYSETDAQGRLTPEKLIDYFQDCSTFQSEDRGIGVERLRRQGLAWIIVYWRVEIHRMPRLGETVRIGTLPYDMKGSIGLRNFLMETEDGERLADANSVWTLVDTRTMHPVRIPAEILQGYPLEPRLEMTYDSRKIRIPAREGREHSPVIVREYHLDTNRHMNNGQYVRIAAGFLPPEREVDILRIEYRKQAVLGDRIIPVVYAQLTEENESDAAGRNGLQAGAPETDAQTSSAGSGAAKRMPGACVSLNADDGTTYAIMEMHFRT